MNSSYEQYTEKERIRWVHQLIALQRIGKRLQEAGFTQVSCGFTHEDYHTTEEFIHWDEVSGHAVYDDTLSVLNFSIFPDEESVIDNDAVLVSHMFFGKLYAYDKDPEWKKSGLDKYGTVEELEKNLDNIIEYVKNSIRPQRQYTRKELSRLNPWHEVGKKEYKEAMERLGEDDD